MCKKHRRRTSLTYLQIVADLLTTVQEHLATEFADRYDRGVRKFDFMGGRRSGKTYFILQFLLSRMYFGDVISVATMTDTQGRLGAYQDAKDIVDSSIVKNYCTVLTSPREVRCTSGGRMFFNSYQSSERAKGIACDWLYINEANNFTEQQYIDLAASVRKGVIADRNPNSECWTERNGFALIHSTWQDNKEHLTPQQLEWFDMLKRKAESPNATSADVAFYRMYYLGEYAEIYGDIFTPSNIAREKVDVSRLRNIAIIADPSNMTGADYFAQVVVGTDGAKVYILDAYSENMSDVSPSIQDWDAWCQRWQPVLDKWREWQARYNATMIFAEDNGVGAEFLRFARGKGWGVKAFTSRENKHRRILNNYDNICNRVVWNETPAIDAYLSQVYMYKGKDDAKVHDDNIDCANNAFDVFYKHTGLMR